MNINWKLRKLIFVFSLLIALVSWLVWPLSQSGREMYAGINMELLLFDFNKVNSRLFSGPTIKYDNGREWFEWYHADGSDTIAIGVSVSKFRFFNFFNTFPADSYFLGKDNLWNKVYETEPGYPKTKFE